MSDNTRRIEVGLMEFLIQPDDERDYDEGRDNPSFVIDGIAFDTTSHMGKWMDYILGEVGIEAVEEALKDVKVSEWYKRPEFPLTDYDLNAYRIAVLFDIVFDKTYCYEFGTYEYDEWVEFVGLVDDLSVLKGTLHE